MTAHDYIIDIVHHLNVLIKMHIFRWRWLSLLQRRGGVECPFVVRPWYDKHYINTCEIWIWSIKLIKIIALLFVQWRKRVSLGPFSLGVKIAILEKSPSYDESCLATVPVWLLVQLLGNFYSNFAIFLISRFFTPNENGPFKSPQFQEWLSAI